MRKIIVSIIVCQYIISLSRVEKEKEKGEEGGRDEGKEGKEGVRRKVDHKQLMIDPVYKKI